MPWVFRAPFPPLQKGGRGDLLASSVPFANKSPSIPLFQRGKDLSDASLGTPSLCVDDVARPGVESRRAAALVFATIALWASLNVLPRAGGLVSIVGLAGITAMASRLRVLPAVHLGLFCTIAGLLLAVPLGLPWLLPLLAALGIYAFVVARVPALRSSSTWLRWGTSDDTVRWLVRATVILSASALLLWYELFHPDMQDVRKMIPPVSFWLLPVVGLLFAAVNAAVEEAAFRGIMMQALDDTIGAGAWSIFIQAAAFGIMHLHGFPRGGVGVALAFLYGLMLGYIRRRARGMYAPWLAHVAADAVIFVIVLVLVR